MGSLKRREYGSQPCPNAWGTYMFIVSGRLTEVLDERLHDLFTYLGQECGWQPSELDRMTLRDMARYADTVSARNERSSKG